MKFSLLLNTNNMTQEGAIKSIFESYDKLGVVILVLSTIFIGLMIMLFLLDKRIKKMEDKIESKY